MANATASGGNHCFQLACVTVVAVIVS